MNGKNLGWPSNYTEISATRPVLNVLRRLLDNRFVHCKGHKQQYGPALPGNRYLPKPAEAYEFWDRQTGRPFSRDFLVGEAADDITRERVRREVLKILQWQGKTRFAAKFTGPARIGFLNSLFPDAYFVHVIRDGRAVVNSLLNVGFWKQKGGFSSPFWHNGLTTRDLKEWAAADHDAAVLAALQWRKIITVAQTESRRLAPERYLEVRYEDFVAAPAAIIRTVEEFAKLRAPQGRASFETDLRVENMNNKVFPRSASADLAQANALISPTLKALGYV